MRMHILMSSILVLLVSGASHAKCKIDPAGADQAIGKKYTVAATMTTGVRVQFVRDRPAYYLDAVFRTVFSGIDAQIDADTPLLLKLDDGQELELPTLEDSETRRTFLGFGLNRKKTGGLYVIPDDSLDDLLNRDVVEIVLQYKTDGVIESRSWEPRKGDKKRFREGLNCILGE